MSDLDYYFREFEFCLKEKQTRGSSCYGELSTTLAFTFFPIKLSSGKRVWLDNYVVISLPWYGSRSNGVISMKLSLDEHAQWLARRAGNKPTKPPRRLRLVT